MTRARRRRRDVASQGILTYRGGKPSTPQSWPGATASVRLRGRVLHLDHGKGRFTVADTTQGGRRHRHRRIAGRWRWGRAVVHPQLSATSRESSSGPMGIRRLKVRTQTPTPEDSGGRTGGRRRGHRARHRTEGTCSRRPAHGWSRRMILCPDPEEDRRAIDELLDLRRGDFAASYEAMSGLRSRSASSTRRARSPSLLQRSWKLAIKSWRVRPQSPHPVTRGRASRRSCREGRHARTWRPGGRPR